jgi:hypothetical protein
MASEVKKMRISWVKDAHLLAKRYASLGQKIRISWAKDAHLLGERCASFYEGVFIYSTRLPLRPVPTWVVGVVFLWLKVIPFE